MSVPYAWRPGGGFVLLLATLLGAAAFFLWGWSTPLLDHVGRIELELKIGRRAPLTKQELARVQQALCDHPKIADDWLEGADIGLVSANRHGLVENGYAYVVRQPGASTRPVIVAQTAGEKKRVLYAQGATRRDSTTAEITADQPLSWTPPAVGKCPTLIEVRAHDGGQKRKPARIRVTFGSAAP